MAKIFDNHFYLEILPKTWSFFFEGLLEVLRVFTGVYSCLIKPYIEIGEKLCCGVEILLGGKFLGRGSPLLLWWE